MITEFKKQAIVIREKETKLMKKKLLLITTGVMLAWSAQAAYLDEDFDSRATGLVTAPSDIGAIILGQPGDNDEIRVVDISSTPADPFGGEMVTKPLVFSGRQLTINFSSSAGGGIHAEIQTPDGKPIKGFAMTDCPEIIGDRIEHTIRWNGGDDVSRLAGKPVRLRFLLRDADLYSLRFK